MGKTKKGILIILGTLGVWLTLAIILPSFQRYKDPDFNDRLQIVTYSISALALVIFCFGCITIFKGIKEKK